MHSKKHECQTRVQKYVAQARQYQPPSVAVAQAWRMMWTRGWCPCHRAAWTCCAPSGDVFAAPVACDSNSEMHHISVADQSNSETQSNSKIDWGQSISWGRMWSVFLYFWMEKLKFLLLSNNHSRYGQNNLKNGISGQNKP